MADGHVKMVHVDHTFLLDRAGEKHVVTGGHFFIQYFSDQGLMSFASVFFWSDS